MQNATQGVRTRWEALVEHQHRRLAQSLFDEIRAHPMDLRPRHGVPWHAGLLLLYAAATLIHGLALGLLTLGLWLLFGDTGLWSKFLGLICTLLAWGARPRFDSAPDTVLDRQRYPTLHALMDRLSERLGAAPIDDLSVSADFNASYWQSRSRWTPWRKQRHVELGAPLLAALRSDMAIAGLLAHELSHGVNGDVLRGAYVGGAVRALQEWSTALRPLELGRAGRGTGNPLISLLALPVELVLLAFSELLILLALGLWLLAMRDSQRAEYLADALAAQAVGSDAIAELLDALACHEVVTAAVRRHALTRPDDPIGPGIANAVDALENAERERLQAQARAAGARADASHPPTHLRREQQSLRPVPAPVPLLNAKEQDQLRIELGALIELQRRELVNRMLEAAHGG